MVSVEAIAEYFETSTVQLNRILKKYDTSGLAVLKTIKQDIVKEMITENKTLEEISKLVPVRLRIDAIDEVTTTKTENVSQIVMASGHVYLVHIDYNELIIRMDEFYLG